MIIPIRSFISLLAIVSLANGALVYRPRRLNDAAHHGLLPRQASASSSSAAASSAAALNNAPNDSPKFDFGTPDPNYPGVVAQEKNGPTNPSKPKLNTPINQTSTSRLASINSVDDWCTFGPMDNSKTLGDVEAETVAYCTKPRNNARVIPDGTVTAAHFVKTPLYVQIMALGDFTKINFQKGDSGGELDPHGATGMGNPPGGLVFTRSQKGNEGNWVQLKEWNNFMSATEYSIRGCWGDNAAQYCPHIYDEMGSYFNEPGRYAAGSFENCDADPGHFPGVYHGSTFWQGQDHTPAPHKPGSSSNCHSYSSVSNGYAVKPLY